MSEREESNRRAVHGVLTAKPVTCAWIAEKLGLYPSCVRMECNRLQRMGAAKATTVPKPGRPQYWVKGEREPTARVPDIVVDKYSNDAALMLARNWK